MHLPVRPSRDYAWSMATRSDAFRAAEQRKRQRPKTAKLRPGRTKPGVPPTLRRPAKKHAARKASYTLEAAPPGRKPSRKSTRKSANRAKPDSNLARRQKRAARSPEERFQRQS